MDDPEEQCHSKFEELLSRALLVKHRNVPRDIVPPDDGWTYDDEDDDY